jgi:predicted Rossmann fold nucleotide-binding protein DprA/Smf involved in DNA uptake
MSPASLDDAFPKDDGLAGRLARLLERAGPVSLELELLRDRGIWVITQFDDDYPQRVRDRLGDDAPPVLYGAGEPALLAGGGLAIVGSRDVDDEGARFAAAIASAAGRAGTQVVSGAARGVDIIAMRAAFTSGGTVVGVPADSLERRIREPETREALSDARLTLASLQVPSTGFSVGGAMGRNKVIYGLAEFALVISAAEGEGGTWAGAIEALQRGTTPVLVRNGGGGPAGNLALLRRGAYPFSIEPDRLTIDDLAGAIGELWASDDGPQQQSLFGDDQPTPSKRKRRPRKSRR